MAKFITEKIGSNKYEIEKFDPGQPHPDLQRIQVRLDELKMIAANSPERFRADKLDQEANELLSRKARLIAQDRKRSTNEGGV